jgi:hypothetical protein
MKRCGQIGEVGSQDDEGGTGRSTNGGSERRARPKAERFDRPLRDGRVFLHHFPALRTGLLSLSPSGTSPQRTILKPLS